MRDARARLAENRDRVVLLPRGAAAAAAAAPAFVAPSSSSSSRRSSASAARGSRDRASVYCRWRGFKQCNHCRGHC